MATEIQSAITPTSVAAASAALDEQERQEAAWAIALDLTGYAAATLAPRELEEVAAYLFALLEREPTKSGPVYAPHRIVLGQLAAQLRGYAMLAGEPVGLEADLRAATSQGEERRIRERIADRDGREDRRRLEEGIGRPFSADEIAEIEADTQRARDRLANRHHPSQREGEPAPATAPPADQPKDPDDAWLL